MSEKDDLVFINHLLENIEDIAQFSEGLTKDKFLGDKLRQKAIVRSIEIIGEAVKNISRKVQDKYPEIEWKDIVGTRDKKIHHYFGVDLNIVWEIIKNDLPDLKIKITRIKKELEK